MYCGISLKCMYIMDWCLYSVPVMQPYADRDSVKNIIYNDEGVDPYGRFFERQEKQGHCSLYAVRNLLETKDVTDYDLHEAAKRVASFTKMKFKTMPTPWDIGRWMQ